MPFNLADNGETSRVGLGAGRLYLRAWAGATPTANDEVGYGRGGSLAITRQKAELKLGVPRRLIMQVAIDEEATLTFNSVEWDVTNLYRAIGGGVTGGSPTDGTLDFGGDLNFADLSARFVHQMPRGGTVTVDLWKCQGSGEATINFTDEFHEYPLALRALQSLTTWENIPVSDRGGLFRLRVQI